MVISKNGALRSFKNYTGIPIQNEADLMDALNQTGLGYTVEMQAHKNARTGADTDWFDLYRADNNVQVGCGVTDRYHVIQNAEAFQPLVEIAKVETDVHIGGAFAFDGGRTAALAVDFGVMSIGDASLGDTVLKRIAFTNSHDGSGSARISITPYRLRCKNGLVSALASSAINIRHTQTAHDRMEQAARILRGIEAQMTKTETAYNVLAKTRVTKDAFAAILETLFPGKEKEGRAAKNAAEAKEAVSRYYADRDGGFLPERDTGWNAFNAVTRYTNHDSGIRVHGVGDRGLARSASVLTGKIAEKNAKALATCIDVLGIEDEISRILASVEASQADNIAAMMDAPAQAGPVVQGDGSLDSILSMMDL